MQRIREMLMAADTSGRGDPSPIPAPLAPKKP
jgi:hypothetical protein